MKEPPHNLPREFVEVYRELLGKTLLTRELLSAKVRRYLGVIQEAAAAQQLDLGTASELGGQILRLLRECEGQDLPHVQVAVYYFLESDDEEPDLSSAEGFMDDVQVFNAVCFHLNRADLKIV